MKIYLKGMISLEETNQKYFKTPMAGSDWKLLAMQTGGIRGRNSYWKLERTALWWVLSEISCGLCQKNRRSRDKKEREKNIGLMLAVALQSQGSIFRQLNQRRIQKTEEPLDAIYDSQHLGGHRAWTKQTKSSAPCFSTSFCCFLPQLLTRSAYWSACFLSHHIYPQFIYYTAWTLYKPVLFSS